MTTTDPTPLAEQIAREHPPQRLPNRRYVMCPTCDTTLSLAGYAAHIATVTEAAVAAQRKAAGPTLEIQAWNATPEEADAIFTAAMGAAYDAAPESVAVDAVGRLAGGAARGGTDE